MFSISGFTFEVQKLYVYLSHIVRQMLFWPLLGIAIAASRARWAQVGWKIVKWNSHMLFSQNCSFVLTADTPFDVFVYTTKWNFLRYVVFLKKIKIFHLFWIQFSTLAFINTFVNYLIKYLDNQLEMFICAANLVLCYKPIWSWPPEKNVTIIHEILFDSFSAGDHSKKN